MDHRPCGVFQKNGYFGAVGKRLLVDRKLLAEIEEPGMVQVELLPSGKGAPRAFLLHLVLERRVGLAFLDFAVPGFLVDLLEALRVLLQLLEGHALGLRRAVEDEVGAVLRLLELAVAAPQVVRLGEVAVPVELLIVVGRELSLGCQLRHFLRQVAEDFPIGFESYSGSSTLLKG